MIVFSSRLETEGHTTYVKAILIKSQEAPPFEEKVSTSSSPPVPHRRLLLKTFGQYEEKSVCLLKLRMPPGYPNRC